MEEDIELEYEEEEEELYTDINIITVPIDFSIETINNHIKRGIIEIPQFQRNFVWTIKQSSEFIDSIFREFPIPPVFLYEKEKNKFVIIDGQQRLLTIFFFMEGRFPKDTIRVKLREIFNRERINEIESLIKNTNNFTDFKLKFDDTKNPRHGKTYYDLQEDERESFKLKYLRAIVIKKISNKDDELKVIPEIFKRLNYGGTKLTPQEIRVALYYSRLFGILFDIIKLKETSYVLGFNVPNPKMKDVEVLLRSIAFLLKVTPEECETGRLSGYSPPLRTFLDKFALESAKFSEEEISFIKELITSFIKGYKNFIEQTGNHPFKEGNRRCQLF